MANRTLFGSTRKMSAPVVDTVNEAGGVAYSLTDKEALAQLAVTGCLNDVFYADAETSLKQVLELAQKVDSAFLAKLALYSRRSAYMKDMPALLCAVLMDRGENDLLASVFNRVIDNAKMLCNFVQIVRSGTVGRKSFGSATKRLIKNWLNSRTREQLFSDSIVQANPSLADVIRMVHPKPANKSMDNMFKYLLGKEVKTRNLPKVVQDFEKFKVELGNKVPDVPFRALTALQLTSDHWKQIAQNAKWTMARMNLNTFARHGVFADSAITQKLALLLANQEEVKRSRVFPYQLMTAFQNVGDDVPMELKLALQDAMEIAVDSVPSLNSKVVVCVDTSGSMQSPVTGYRKGSTTKTSCVDVAALFASVILRKNPGSKVLPFDTSVHPANLNPRDSIMTNAKYLSQFGGGGTDCSCALRHLNNDGTKADLVVYFSDNESWYLDKNRWGRGTSTMQEWLTFKKRNPKAKLVLVDLQPYATTTAKGKDILNVGGWSDQVFNVLESFVKDGNQNFVKVVESAVDKQRDSE